MRLKVNEPVAQLFFYHCLGESNGHMAMIPNSPVLQSIAIAHGVASESDFADFLIEVAKHLKGEEK